MFQPLTKGDFAGTWDDACVYCRPTCFVDRPHELDDACLRIADTMVWFAAWQVSLRDDGAVRSAIVPVPELGDWIA
ncbi:MAG: dihydropteroate synthase, partial [Alphaproteobacteria bacterium HGW-Alphaproteobacteria-13]